MGGGGMGHRIWVRGSTQQHLISVCLWWGRMRVMEKLRHGVSRTPPLLPSRCLARFQQTPGPIPMGAGMG